MEILSLLPSVTRHGARRHGNICATSTALTNSAPHPSRRPSKRPRSSQRLVREGHPGCRASSTSTTLNPPHRSFSSTFQTQRMNVRPSCLPSHIIHLLIDFSEIFRVPERHHTLRVCSHWSFPDPVVSRVFLSSQFSLHVFIYPPRFTLPSLSSTLRLFLM